jgi:eukaryotic translation initiation factor 2C
MVDIAFSKPQALRTWSWLCFDTNPRYRVEDANLNAGFKELTKILNNMGVTTNAPLPGRRVMLNGNNDAEVVERAVRELQTLHKPNLILGILPGKEAPLYNIIKQVCDVRCGVQNVNVQASKFGGEKGRIGADPQYCANVGLKINLKMGGQNQRLEPSQLGIFADGKTMLVGLDVTHPSPGSAGTAPSVAAIVASVDSHLAQWPAEIRIQKARQEMVDDLEALLKSRILRWGKSNQNKLPENIVVYRDGVSEGQYDTVVDTELPLLRKACNATYPASVTKKGLPRIAIVIVGKRHNTRFYAAKRDESDFKSHNPQPGTVVDRGISEARNWDFYLQAHAALQGTARPAHYFTVWDEIFNAGKPGRAGDLGAADTLQKLTHNLCYMFGRATKAVSVCPPAYYADLVCTRARCYLSDQFDPTLSMTPAASVAGTEGVDRVPDKSSVVLHPNIADTMFYI